MGFSRWADIKHKSSPERQAELKALALAVASEKHHVRCGRLLTLGLEPCDCAAPGITHNVEPQVEQTEGSDDEDDEEKAP